MPMYAILRNMAGLSDEELDAAGYRAVACALEYEGLRWHRSILDRQRGTMICLYEARSEDEIREHAMRARIPCDEVREVEEVLPDPYLLMIASATR